MSSDTRPGFSVQVSGSDIFPDTRRLSEDYHREQRLSAPVLTASWKADKSGGVGKPPVNIQLQAFGNVAKPEFGPDWQLRFQIQFLFPK